MEPNKLRAQRISANRISAAADVCRNASWLTPGLHVSTIGADVTGETTIQTGSLRSVQRREYPKARGENLSSRRENRTAQPSRRSPHLDSPAGRDVLGAGLRDNPHSNVRVHFRLQPDCTGSFN